MVDTATCTRSFCEASASADESLFLEIDFIGNSFDSIIDFFRFFDYCQNITSHPNVTFYKVKSTLTRKRGASTASEMHTTNNANSATLSNRCRQMHYLLQGCDVMVQK